MNLEADQFLAVKGATVVGSIEDLVTTMIKPRILWLMVPVSVVDKVLSTSVSMLEEGGNDYTNRVLSAMRRQFGGHDEKKEGKL